MLLLLLVGMEHKARVSPSPLPSSARASPPSPPHRVLEVTSINPHTEENLPCKLVREEEDETTVNVVDGEAVGGVDGDAHHGGGDGVAEGQEDSLAVWARLNQR